MSEPPAVAETLTVARRFCGPPASANGGYVAGLLAARTAPLGAAVTVTLRQPPPLEQALAVVTDGDTTRLLDGDLLIAEAVAGSLAADPVPPVSLAEARAAEPHYPGLDDHSFDGCFVCGPGRRAGDGLGLRPGPVGPGRSACSWTPDPSLADADDDAVAAPEFVWAAMDCPGGWTSDLVARPLVLGRMTAAVHRLPAIGRPVVIVGQLLETTGRKTLTAVSAYDEDGTELGHAEQVWIEVDPAVFYPEGGYER